MYGLPPGNNVARNGSSTRREQLNGIQMMTPTKVWFCSILILLVGCGVQQEKSTRLSVTPKTLKHYSYPPQAKFEGELVDLIGVSDNSAPNDLLLTWYRDLGTDEKIRQGQNNFRVIKDLIDGKKSIDCSDCILDSQLIRMLTQSKIDWLRLGDLESSRELEWISKINGLKGLSVGFAKHHQIDISRLEKLHELKWLAIRLSAQNSSTSFPSMVKLESLYVRGRHSNGLALQDGQFPSLVSLSVPFSAIDDEMLQSLSETNQELRFLDIRFCTAISLDSFWAFEKFKKLRKLDVGGTLLEEQLYDNFYGGIPRLQQMLEDCEIAYGD